MANLIVSIEIFAIILVLFVFVGIVMEEKNVPSPGPTPVPVANRHLIDIPDEVVQQMVSETTAGEQQGWQIVRCATCDTFALWRNEAYSDPRAYEYEWHQVQIGKGQSWVCPDHYRAMQELLTR